MRSKHNKPADHKGAFLAAVLLVLAMPLSIGGLPAFAAAVPTTDLVEGAKKEGKLVVYSSVSASDTATLVKSFQAKYPFIKATFLRLGSGRLMTKIFQEAQAGAHNADVFQTGSLEVYLFKKKGLVGKYLSPERKFYQDYFKDAEGYSTSFYFTPKVISYNTRMVSPDKAPKSYHDLLLPQWKGQMGMPGDNPGVRWFIGMMKRVGDDKGADFMRRLAAQQLKYQAGITEATALMVAGEYPILVFTNADSIEELKRKGAPVEWVADEPVTTTQTVLGLASRAANPNSAKLYIDFILSREGQEIIRSFQRIPARSEIESDPPKLKKGLKFFPYFGEWAEDEVRYAEKFREIFR